MKEVTGTIGFGFKKIEESRQWTGMINGCETLYVWDKTKVSNQNSRGGVWDGSKPVIDEIVFKG